MNLLLMADSRIQAIDPDSPEPAHIKRAVNILMDGGVIVAPTETRYGLVARADRVDAVDRIYEVKNRPEKMPMAVFLETVESIAEYANVNESARRLASKFLPGPLTLVLPAAEGWKSRVVFQGTVGIRVSLSPVIGALLAAVSRPLTATSANLSGAVELATVTQVAAVFRNRVDLYLDGGSLTGLPSTVVDCTGTEVKILREGAIMTDRIQQALEGRTS